MLVPPEARTPIVPTPSPGPAPKPSAPPEKAPAAPVASWAFAVSGDSRDCGDVVMPKITASITGISKTTPVAFYWHLGDFRNGRQADRDYFVLNGGDEDYRSRAWDDFLARQIAPLEAVTQVFLGIGNHELIYPWWGHEEYEAKFGRFLLQEPIATQRVVDRKAGLVGDRRHVDYHFVKNGVDFIYLDNSDTYAFAPSYLLHPAFTDEQLAWLKGVLALDAADDSVKAIVVGMHAALPFSSASSHAMDDTCHGRQTGQLVYDLLWNAQGLGGPPEKKKKVYVLASHAHDFEEDIFAKGHPGKVLPGWIIGTAGAPQHSTPIRYGYILFTAHPDGAMDAKFVTVAKGDPPLAKSKGESDLFDWCWARNAEPEHHTRRVNCGSGGR